MVERATIGRPYSEYQLKDNGVDMTGREREKSLILAPICTKSVYKRAKKLVKQQLQKR